MVDLPVVVVTGAAGRIGRAVVERLGGHWDVRATDLRGDGVAALDVTDEQACRKHFAGADAVLHLAAVPDPEAAWEELLPANVVGTYCVAAAAMAVGVRRLVLASSLQAVSGYRERNRQPCGCVPAACVVPRRSVSPCCSPS